MASIKRVAVLGGSGNLGPTVIRELLAAGFSVTAVTREASAAAASRFPDGVDVRTVPDYGSFDSLRAALDGHDAVVSVVGTAAVPAQRTAIDAALAAGVRRFVPSEFGLHTRKARGTPIGDLLQAKIAIVDYLEQVAAQNPGFTWTGLSTGLFFDWALERLGAGVVSLRDRTATVIDSGDEKWQASTLAHVGRAVAGILARPAETANRYLATASFNVSQNELVALVEQLAGARLAVARQASADVRAAGEQKLARGDPAAFVDFLRVHNNADGAGNALREEESANSLLGLPYEDVRAVVESWLRKAGEL